MKGYDTLQSHKINLTPPYSKVNLSGADLTPTLTCLIHDSDPERRFPAVIAVPGGSYEHCSKREGEPCAARWYSHGYNSFVLDYSCVDKPFPTALLELAAAVEYFISAGLVVGGAYHGDNKTYRNADYHSEEGYHQRVFEAGRQIAPALKSQGLKRRILNDNTGIFRHGMSENADKIVEIILFFHYC